MLTILCYTQMYFNLDQMQSSQIGEIFTQGIVKLFVKFNHLLQLVEDLIANI